MNYVFWGPGPEVSRQAGKISHIARVQANLEGVKKGFCLQRQWPRHSGQSVLLVLSNGGE